MPAPELDTAEQFRSAAEDALRSGDFGPVVALLAPDVECVTPLHTLQGDEAIGALTDELGRGRPTESFEIDFENGDWNDLGKGRYSCEIRALYRSKVSEADSYDRRRSFDLTIREERVSRFEMGFAD